MSVERDARAVLQLERRAREAWLVVAHRADAPSRRSCGSGSRACDRRRDASSWCLPRRSTRSMRRPFSLRSRARRDPLRERRMQQPQPRDRLCLRRPLASCLRAASTSGSSGMHGKLPRDPTVRTTPARHCTASVAQGAFFCREHTPRAGRPQHAHPDSGAERARRRRQDRRRHSHRTRSRCSAQRSNPALDVLNNIVGIALVRVASQEPDEDHPYGHQKFETLGRARHCRISLDLLLRAAARRRAAR